MNFNIRNRFLILGIVFIGLFAVLFVQLIKLTLVKGADYAASVGALSQRTITISGARGSIFDRSGLPLAYDQKSYNVQFYKDPTKGSTSDKAYYTNIIMDTIKLIENNSEKTVDTFAIKHNKDTGEFYFYWGDITPQAQIAREKNWRDNMYVGTSRTPEEIYLYLRDKYQIPSEMGYDDARKILSIWQDVQLSSWVAYTPINVAYNVSTQTVAEIETHCDELVGMSIAESTTRIYPRGSLAANVIGYMSRIPDTMSENQIKALEASGYNLDDLIGVDGIEKTMEKYLTGNNSDRQGKEQVEVDNMAVVKNVLSSTEPKQGDNVVLTIDVPLQQAVEESLATNIPKIKAKQESIYQQYKDTRYKGLDLSKINLANSGAAVVLDVNTGQVLAMASYPNFDLNLFTGSISDTDYKALLEDPATPLFNKAVSSRGTPGSIFKMVTGLGALMENKTTLSEKISDGGEYTAILAPNGKGPKCWTKNILNHQDQTIVEGLKNSCDFYFYTLADRLGISLLDKWGEKYGLTSSTGIELPGEAIGQIGNQQVLYDNTKSIGQQDTFIPSLVKNGQYGIVKLLNGFAKERGIEYGKGVIDKTADALIYLAGIKWTADQSDKNILKDENGKTMGEYVREIMSKNMQISTKVSSANGWDVQIAQMLSQLIWTPYMTITSGIGQGVVQVTPLAIARYVAAVVNGGTVYETHVVDKVEDQSGAVLYDQQPVVYDTLDAPPDYLDALKKGMQAVVSAEDGTASQYFQNFEYTDQIGGKTGTAQVSNIDLEDNSWFVCFAPYDKPEIAIVVYVPHGLSGGQSTCVAKDIIQFYMDREKTVSQQNIPSSNSLVN